MHKKDPFRHLIEQADQRVIDAMSTAGLEVLDELVRKYEFYESQSKDYKKLEIQNEWILFFKDIIKAVKRLCGAK